MNKVKGGRKKTREERKVTQEGHIKDKELILAILYLYNQETYKLGLNLLRKLEDKGVDEAELELSIEFLNGNFKDKNRKVLNVFKKFSEVNEPRALLNLGYCFDYGIETKINKKQAFKYYMKAALLDLSQAQFNLAMFYEKGFGVRKNLSKAISWYRKADELGDYEASNSLGWYYLNGVGVRKDYSKAFILFKKASRNNIPSAYANLGYLYLNGFGVKKNFKAATKYLILGKTLGSSYAEYLLGTINR